MWGEGHGGEKTRLFLKRRGEEAPPPTGWPQGRSAPGALTDPALPVLPRPFRLRLLPDSPRTGRGHEEDVTDASPSSSGSLPITTSFSKMVSRALTAAPRSGSELGPGPPPRPRPPRGPGPLAFLAQGCSPGPARRLLASRRIYTFLPPLSPI